MHPEHEQRFNRIVSDYRERPGGDYAELLRRGQVSSTRGSGSRAVARRDPRSGTQGQDPIRVVITSRNSGGAFAARHRPVSDAEMRVELARGEMLRSLAATARELGHHPRV